MKFFTEFKEFALKGNVIDLAVGVIIGAAFGNVVTSLTNDVIMPPLGWLIGGIDFTNLSISLPAIGDHLDAVQIRYGNFIQTIINFLIIAMSIFFAIKVMNKLRRNDDDDDAPQNDAISKEEVLLSEIKDMLKK